MKKIYLYRFLYAVFLIPALLLQIVWFFAILPFAVLVSFFLVAIGYIMYGDCDRYEPISVFEKMSLAIIWYYIDLNDKIKEKEYKLKNK